MSEKEFKPAIAFDFDGVIAHYNGFTGDENVGEPNEEVVSVIRQLKEHGCTIIIHSTRGNDVLRNYCNTHNIPVDFINENPTLEGRNRGKPIATVYVDDRALNYHGQTADALLAEIKNFKVYWKDGKNSKMREYWEKKN